ncbi:hypothetical protein [Streptomyces sp. NPDC058664]|uniref:hypothetical protein n=1 Tax=unclassified Streptomyces TaxID=2593676 RepID=UPI00365F174F
MILEIDYFGGSVMDNMDLNITVDAELEPGMGASSYVYEGGKPVLASKEEGAAGKDWIDN